MVEASRWECVLEPTVDAFSDALRCVSRRLGPFAEHGDCHRMSFPLSRACPCLHRTPEDYRRRVRDHLRQTWWALPDFSSTYLSRARGSSASRSASPSRFNVSTVSTNAIPGKSASHQALCNTR